MRVPFADLAAQDAPIAGEILEAIGRVAREGKFILGASVEQFERWLAGACGAAHAVGVASGSDALELSLRALGVGAGDAVVTPALSFIATAEAIVAAGARPVFCDVDPDTMNATAQTIECAVDRAHKAGISVRAVVPVHLFGRCATMEAQRTIDGREDLLRVEDAAQALGALDAAGRPAGGIGDAGCFSFFPSKSLGAWGDGGAVVTSREDVAARVRRLRAHGATAPNTHPELGRNSRLDAVQAAVLLTKAPHLDSWQKARAHAARRYRAELSHLPLMLPTEPDPPALHAWHAFVLRCERRDLLAHWLAEKGVETRVYYPVPLHRQACFASLREPPLPGAEDVCRTALALPIFPAISEDQQSHVIAQTARFFEVRG